MKRVFLSWDVIKFSIGLFLFFYAVALHMAVFQTFPDPLIDPDSGGYLLPALNLLYEGALKIDSFRTEGYPLFLALFLKVSNSFSVVLLIQHGLLFLTAVMAGILYFKFLNKSIPQAFLVGFASSIAPEPLLYSHWIMTETLFSFFLILATVFFFLSL